MCREHAKREIAGVMNRTGARSARESPRAYPKNEARMALLGGTAVLLLHLGSSAQPPAVPPPFAGPGIALAPIFTDHAVRMHSTHAAWDVLDLATRPHVVT